MKEITYKIVRVQGAFLDCHSSETPKTNHSKPRMRKTLYEESGQIKQPNLTCIEFCVNNTFVFQKML